MNIKDLNPEDYEVVEEPKPLNINDLDPSDYEPVEEIPAPVNTDISEGESALMGGMQGASLGFVDELAGGLEAIGSKVGLRGLGGSFSDIRLENDEEDKQTFKEVYEQARNSKRDTYREAEAANPKSFLAGNVAGGVASGLTLPAGGATTTAKLLRQGAAAGALGGAGMSEGEGFDLVKDTAEGAAIGAAFPAAARGLKALKPLTKKAAKVIGQVPEEVTERYIARNKQVRDSVPLEDVAKRAQGAVKKLSEEVSEGSSAGYGVLAEEGVSVPKEQVLQVFDDKIKALMKDNVAGPQLKSAVTKLSAFKDAVKKDKLGELSGGKVKNIIRQIDDEINYNDSGNAAFKQTTGGKTFSAVRRGLDEQIKSRSPAYAEQMEQVSKRADLLGRVGPKFGKTEQAYNQLKGIAAEKRPLQSELLGELDETVGSSIGEEARDSLVADVMKRASTQGSRSVNMGRAAGRVLGPIGEFIGGGTGYIADQFGRKGISKAIDFASIAQRMPAKYRSALQYGADKSANAASVNHYLMFQNDPNYRKAYEEAQQSVDSE